MNCGFCQHELLETDKKATLLCDHVVHTKCFILRSLYIIEQIHCAECFSPIVPAEMLVELNANTNNECEKLFETSEGFRNDVEKIISKTKEFKKKRKLLVVKVNNVYKEFNLFLTPQKSIIKNYIDAKMKLIKGFQEYKDAQKENLAIKRLQRQFCDTHNVTDHKLVKFLHNKYPNIVQRFFYRFSHLMPNFNRKFSVCIR